jgi:hypothetical protein
MNSGVASHHDGFVLAQYDEVVLANKETVGPIVATVLARWATLVLAGSPFLGLCHSYAS